MKIPNGKTMKLSILALAIQGALVSVPARADEGLKVPMSFVEAGGLYVTQDSAKFGEYTGLHKSGVYGIGNFGIRGGDAYGDSNGTQRWEVTGNDLGLSSRSAAASISDQGRWSLGLSFDQLRHYTSDSYQTPYTGTMGGNSWTLPTFGTAANARTLSAAQLAQFRAVDISNDRDNIAASGTYLLDRNWSVKVDFNQLEQSGAKLLGFGGANFGGANPTGERVAILPMPQNYRTYTTNLAVNWIGEKAHATMSYFGSYFRDQYNGVRFDTWAGSNLTETMGTPPSNTLHQLNLSGGYALSQRTKLAGGLSYSYNTQDTAYNYDTAAMVTASPTDSLHGVVRNTHADLKLTDQTTRDLILSTGLKYDARANNTASNIYNFRAISGGNIANYPNAPISLRKSQFELAGDYRLSTAQKVRLGYNHDDTQRYCEQYATGGASPAYAPGTECVSVPRTKEDKLGLTYRLKAADGVNLNAGYSYADRRSTRVLDARAPMIGTDGNVVVPGAAITGLNAGEFRGFNPFFEASRRQHMVKGGANWQPGEQFSVGLNGRFTEDRYRTDFGMQEGRSWSLNLDSTYVFREKGTITAFATRQERRRDMTNEARSPTTAASATVPSGATWNNTLKDTDTTLGLNIKQGGLMDSRLELAGDAMYSRARTDINTTLNYALLSGAPCADPSVYTCVALPTIKTDLYQVRFTGTYRVDKSAKVAMGYLYQRLKAEDFYYNGLQNGFTPTSVLPTNQAAPSYSVSMIFASYIYSFE